MRRILPVLLAAVAVGVLAAAVVGVVVVGCGMPAPQPVGNSQSTQKRLEATASVDHAWFSPDGKLLMTQHVMNDSQYANRQEFGEFRPLRIWHVATGTELGSYEEPASHGLVFLPDGNIVGSMRTGKGQTHSAPTTGSGRATGDRPGEVLAVWEPTTGKVRRLDEEFTEVECLGISADGKYLLTLGRYEDPPPLASAKVIGPQGGPPILAADQSRSPRPWAGISPPLPRLDIRNAATGKRLHTLSEGRFQAATFTPDGKQVYTRPFPRSTEGTPIGIWDVAGGKLIRHEDKKDDWKYPEAFSPDGKLALCDRWDVDGANLVLWELASGEVVRQFEKRPGGAAAIAFRPDGKQAVSLDWDGTLRLWDVATGKQLLSLRLNQEELSAQALSSDGMLAFTASGKQVGRQNGIQMRIWDTSSGKLLRTLEVPRRSKILSPPVSNSNNHLTPQHSNALWATCNA